MHADTQAPSSTTPIAISSDSAHGPSSLLDSRLSPEESSLVSHLFISHDILCHYDPAPSSPLHPLPHVDEVQHLITVTSRRLPTHLSTHTHPISTFPRPLSALDIAYSDLVWQYVDAPLLSPKASRLFRHLADCTLPSHVSFRPTPLSNRGMLVHARPDDRARPRRARLSDRMLLVSTKNRFELHARLRSWILALDDSTLSHTTLHALVHDFLPIAAMRAPMLDCMLG
ncbi:hypothetical protein FIBSPDRAFT_947337 [Athelia psychrophila]|uniref:Uncharacterized protein n=1 Tax=Athelia psychrophila TaxID=1759441 RepID=A0A166S2F6_9AGAM|nr:hypothetical protein FIBSPDRAFT_947337 [Fibularhizoctonia sp. CBS 109695]